MNKQETDSFDENQSLQVIRDMIEVSQKRVQSDGILFIVWGWTAFLNYFFFNYLPSIYATGYWLTQAVHFLQIALPVFALAFTLFYVIKKSQKATTYIGTVLRYIWVTLFFSMVLVNLIQFNVVQNINFELQHPIFMVLIAFATIVSGGLLRYRLIVGGGVIFALLAFLCSYLPLQEQVLVEAIAWMIAFIIPGHLLYLKRNR